jgi:hypothetical protein
MTAMSAYTILKAAGWRITSARYTRGRAVVKVEDRSAEFIYRGKEDQTLEQVLDVILAHATKEVALEKRELSDG